LNFLLFFFSLPFPFPYPSKKSNNITTKELIDWYLELGRAHMNDAYLLLAKATATASSSSNDGNSNKNNVNNNDYLLQHPNKKYHIELAINSYNIAKRTLRYLTDEAEMNPLIQSNKDTKNRKGVDNTFDDINLRLHYQSIIYYNLGIAYSDMIGSNSVDDGSLPKTDSSSQEDKAYSEKSVSNLHSAQSSYEKLRYAYSTKGNDDNNNDDNDDNDKDETNYDRIEKGYADSCNKLGMALYHNMIFKENEKVSDLNDKTMKLVKSTFGLDSDASENDIVTALMAQAMGGGGGAGNGAAGNAGAGAGAGAGGAYTFTLDLDDVDGLFGDMMGDGDDILSGIFDMGGIGGGIGLDGLGGDNNNKSNEKKKKLLNEISTYIDTAILTYQYHANYPPSPSSQHNKKKNGSSSEGFIVIVNGVKRKSKKEMKEEIRILNWRYSLAISYQNAAMIATIQNKHIRSRELMNLALELYLNIIIPYYKNNNDSSSSSSSTVITSNPGSMTFDNAKTSVGDLYVSLADVAIQLGQYKDGKTLYTNAMDWYDEYDLKPSSPSISSSIRGGGGGGSDNLYGTTLLGDDATVHQYEEFITTYEEQLIQYKRDLKSGSIYKDDSYEAEMLMTIAPMYLSIDKSQDAINSYRDVIKVYERIASDATPEATATNNNNDDDDVKGHRRALLNIADAQYGLAISYFHNYQFDESLIHYTESADTYIDLYGEGNSPKDKQADKVEDMLEEMKDIITEQLGEEYYENIMKSTTTTTGSSSNSKSSDGNGGGSGTSSSDHPKVANFDIDNYYNRASGLHNSTIYDDDDDDDDDDHI
jgi:hypothetical protein